MKHTVMFKLKHGFANLDSQTWDSSLVCMSEALSRSPQIIVVPIAGQMLPQQ